MSTGWDFVKEIYHRDGSFDCMKSYPWSTSREKGWQQPNWITELLATEIQNVKLNNMQTDVDFISSVTLI